MEKTKRSASSHRARSHQRGTCKTSAPLVPKRQASQQLRCRDSQEIFVTNLSKSLIFALCRAKPTQSKNVCMAMIPSCQSPVFSDIKQLDSCKHMWMTRLNLSFFIQITKSSSLQLGRNFKVIESLIVGVVSNDLFCVVVRTEHGATGMCYV